MDRHDHVLVKVVLDERVAEASAANAGDGSRGVQDGLRVIDIPSLRF